jgi:hypothetical protein
MFCILPGVGAPEVQLMEWWKCFNEANWNRHATLWGGVIMRTSCEMGRLRKKK